VVIGTSLPRIGVSSMLQLLGKCIYLMENLSRCYPRVEERKESKVSWCSKTPSSHDLQTTIISMASIMGVNKLHDLL
jgi:hypothetical protein